MKIREWLEKNKIFFETVTAVLLALMAISVSYFQCNISKNQLAISVEPRLLIEPSEIVKGSIGEFELTIKNPSLAEIYDVRIYEDYFVTLTNDDNRVQLIRIGIFTTLPDTIILQLKPNDETKFNISFKSIIEQMRDFYTNRKGLKMRIMRLIIKYRRKLDGKEFKQTKAYVIGEDGDHLFDNDDREVKTPNMPNFNEIKNILGASNN
ncbi:hypothetical protein ACFLSV_01080 [Bacteroidota bacterium]